MRQYKDGEKVIIWNKKTVPEIGTILFRKTPKGGNYAVDMGDGVVCCDHSEIYRFDTASKYLLRDIENHISETRNWLKIIKIQVYDKEYVYKSKKD